MKYICKRQYQSAGFAMMLNSQKPQEQFARTFFYRKCRAITPFRFAGNVRCVFFISF